MKSERRHNLESNELVAWLEKFRPYLGQATAVVSVVVVLLAAKSIWSSGSTAKQEAAWDAFALANDTSDPELMAVLSAADNSEYAGTSMPEWAHVTWADRQLLLASHAYLADRPAALSRLKKISGIYSTLATGASDREVQNRARYGLAHVYELQNKLDEAKQQYETVQGDLSSLARQRAARLELPGVQEACVWLATADLPRPTPGSSQDAEGSRPSFDAEVPAVGSDEVSTKTLEDLLENLVEETADTDDRYGEESESEAPAESGSEEPATDANAVEAENSSEASETPSDTAEGQ